MDRRDTVKVFRDRLAAVIGRSGLSQTAYALAVGIDRSTLSQLLSETNDRLPRADSLVAIAAYSKVSLDWLLGLTQREQVGADIVAEAITVEHDAPSPIDERLMRWHVEAEGYKIRTVPSNFPDLLKTEAVLRFEYDDFAGRGPQRGIETAHARLAYMRRPDSDMEACVEFQALEAFARGEGRWRGLGATVRRAQLDRLIELTEELYPTFRWYLYDRRQVFSSPLTIFGPQRAAVYIGQMYFVFNATEQIRTLSRHFDTLIRAAVYRPTDVPRFLRQLRGEV